MKLAHGVSRKEITIMSNEDRAVMEVTRKVFNKVWDYAVEGGNLHEDEFHEEQTDVAGKKRYFIKRNVFDAYKETVR